MVHCMSNINHTYLCRLAHRWSHTLISMKINHRWVNKIKKYYHNFTCLTCLHNIQFPPFFVSGPNFFIPLPVPDASGQPTPRCGWSWGRAALCVGWRWRWHRWWAWSSSCPQTSGKSKMSAHVKQEKHWVWESKTSAEVKWEKHHPRYLAYNVQFCVCIWILIFCIKETNKKPAQFLKRRKNRKRMTTCIQKWDPNTSKAKKNTKRTQLVLSD